MVFSNPVLISVVGASPVSASNFELSQTSRSTSDFSGLMRSDSCDNGKRVSRSS